MDIRHISTFKKVVETGSITAAARTLGYAQPTVTLHIQIIEKDLGVQVFDRVGKKLMLTEAGREMYKYSQELDQIFNRIVNIGTSTGGCRRSLIRIAVPPAIVSYLMYDIFDKFIRNIEDVDFEIINDYNLQVTYKYLLDGNIDFAILPGSWHSNELLQTELLGECDHVLVASKYYEIGKVNLTKPGNPLGARMIYNHYLSSSHLEFSQYLERMNIQPDSYLEVWNMDVIKACVNKCLGIAFVPRFVVHDELSNNSFVTIPLNYKLARYRINLAYMKNKWKAPMHMLFRDFIHSEFEASALDSVDG